MSRNINHKSLIDPVTSENLAERIRQLLNQPGLRRQMGEFNRQYAQEHFYAGRVVKRLESIYAEVASEQCCPGRHVV